MGFVSSGRTCVLQILLISVIIFPFEELQLQVQSSREESSFVSCFFDDRHFPGKIQEIYSVWENSMSLIGQLLW